MLRDLRTALNGIQYLVERSSHKDDLDALSTRLFHIQSLLQGETSPEGKTLLTDVDHLLEVCQSKTRDRRFSNVETLLTESANEKYVFLVGWFLLLAIIALYIQTWNATLRMLHPRQI